MYACWLRAIIDSIFGGNMARAICYAVMGCLAACLGVFANAAPFAYITNNAGSTNTVSVINIASNAVIATITVGVHPVGTGLTPDGARVYVANEQSGNVSVISTATNKVIATVPTGAGPTGVAVTP